MCVSEFCGGAKNAEEAFLLWQTERGGCLKSQKTNHPARPNGKRLAFLGI